ncbi:type VI secretion system Vgr family protein [Variovorax boronicumulans]|uniref:type VI secretion system Vgr family protein n=1 Tax=Variovorax boronicumulans TaxID=436515 RepID=UPI0033947AEA
MPQTLSVTSTAIPTSLGLPALVPVRLAGREGVNGLFEYELILKTPDALNLGASGAADFNLDGFIGHAMTCVIGLDGSGELRAGAIGPSTHGMGAGTRQISGIVTDAVMEGEAGRHVVYRFIIRPWLHLATLNCDCKIYQDQTVVKTLDQVLGNYSFPVEKRLYDTYPIRDYCVQWNESDFEFFERLCQEYGINYHFEHGDGAHRLVLSDAMAAYRECPSAAYANVEFHAPGYKTDAEYIHRFASHNQLTSGAYVTRDYDYTRSKARLIGQNSAPRSTSHANGEVYQYHASVGGSHFAQPEAGVTGPNDPSTEARAFARLRMQHLRTHGARAHASGNLRGMVPGCTFRMQKHPRESANAEYLILHTNFVIEDVGQDSQIKGAAPGRSQNWKVSVDFTAHPLQEELRPAPTRAKPQTGGPQNAVVVGPAGQSIWTDEYGRIKVQFPWDRDGQFNQNSSCKVRVSAAWAGNQLGAMHVPRIGQEVVIEFFGGDPDLPICTGRVYNQMNMPPYKLPDQAALSGFRSRELVGGGGNSAAGRSNQLVLDDTAGKIQVQLKSDHQSSSLSLGAITRIEDNAGRKDPRGQGYELRTDGHGVLRAADGMLITTEACMDAAGHAKLLGEALPRLTLARDLIEGQSDAARISEAQTKGDQDAVAKALKKQNDAIKGSGGNPQEGQFPELADPHLVLASPSGIAVTSGGSTHIASVEHTQITSSAHTSINSGGSLIAVALEAFKVYAMQNGMEVIAAQADIEIKALNNSIKMLAKDKIELTADVINITAKTQLTINGGGSYGEYSAGNITKGTAGKYTNHAAIHGYAPADSKAPEKLNGEACGTKEKAADKGGNSVPRR